MRENCVKRTLCCAGILFLGLLAFSTFFPGESPAAEVQPDCDIQSGGCQKTLNDRTIELEILPRPVKAMSDLTFRVRILGAPLTGAPSIDLGMPGMNMGRNHVKLEKNSMDVYEGRGVIVRCHSGKTVWQATVNLPDAGKVIFTFDVVY